MIVPVPDPWDLILLSEGTLFRLGVRDREQAEELSTREWIAEVSRILHAEIRRLARARTQFFTEWT